MKVRSQFLSLAFAAMAATASAGEAYKQVPVSAPAPSNGGFYASVQGGALWLQDVSLDGVDVEFDTGFSVIGTLGYAFGNGFALELESGYAKSDVDSVNFGPFSTEIDAEFKQVPIFANAVYWADLTDRLGLYVGAGAGALWSEIDSRDFGSEDDWNFAFQAKAGASFKVSQAVSLNVGYRFIFGVDTFSVNNDIEDDSLAHVLEGGLTIRF